LPFFPPHFSQKPSIFSFFAPIFSFLGVVFSFFAPFFSFLGVFIQKTVEPARKLGVKILEGVLANL